MLQVEPAALSVERAVLQVERAALLVGPSEGAAADPSRRRTIQRQTSKVDLEMAKLRLVGLRAWEYQRYYLLDGGLSYTYRDEGMAYALRTLRALRFPKSKIAVWAHNSHISRNPHPFNDGRPMGSFLAAALGAAYANIGLAAWEVEID